MSGREEESAKLGEEVDEDDVPPEEGVGERAEALDGEGAEGSGAGGGGIGTERGPGPCAACNVTSSAARSGCTAE